MVFHYERNKLMESPSIAKENVNNSYLKTYFRKNYIVKNKNMLIILSFFSIITPVKTNTNIQYFTNKAGIFLRIPKKKMLIVKANMVLQILVRKQLHLSLKLKEIEIFESFNKTISVNVFFFDMMRRIKK